MTRGRRMRAARRHGEVLLLVGALTTGCSRSPATESGPMPSGRSWTTPPRENADGGIIAAKLPRVGHRGGPFVRNPRIMTVTFSGDDPNLVTRLEQFGDSITRTAWWRAAVDDYCVGTDCIGEGRGAQARLDRKLAPSTSVGEVMKVLREAAEGRLLGSVDPSTLLIAYLPPGVELYEGSTKYCEPGPRALHRSFEVGGKPTPFAIVPRCGEESEVTATASHEILEATTNPDPSRPGFAFAPGSAAAGFTSSGKEPVDPCGVLTMDEHRAFEGGFVLQRAWSNREASLGRNPCVPTRPGRPYIALVAKTPAVRLAAVGDTATVELEAAADKQVPRWAVSTIDLTGFQNKTTYVEATLDKHTVAAGETATLTIVLKAVAPKQLAVVGIVSSLGTYSHLWPVAVSMR